MRKAAIACGVVGVVFLVGAGLLAFWITPQFIARLPANSNTVRTYDGQIRSLVDPVALQQGNFAAAIKVGLPETLRQQVQVQQTSGNTALVRDANTATVSGRQIGAVTSHYAVDRQSLEATRSHPGNWNVTPASGLTVSWPIGAKQQNYTGWVDFTQTTTPLKYLRQEQHGGVSTYVYQATVPATPIRNPQVLQGLPRSMPARVLQQVGKSGLVSPSLLAGLAKFRPAAQIPLGYTYEGTSTYWVAPATGEVVDISTAEKEMGGVALSGGKIIPVIPVLADSYRGSNASVQAAAADATNGGNTIQAFGTIVPIVAAVLGFVLVVIAVVLWMRSRRPRAGAPA
jgi:Porin PorA